MARKSQRAAHPDVVDEIESLGERAAEWVSNHGRAVLGTAAVVLIAAATAGGWATYEDRQEATASDAFDGVQRAYVSAMGGSPGSIDVPELANPEAAKRIQGEFAREFEQMASEHGGTVAATLARIEQGRLLEAAGDLEGALAVWEQTEADLPAGDALRGLVLQRRAQAYETAGRWAEAGESHAVAAEIEDFPLRYWAMVDAARCYAEAGDAARAVELFQRVETEAPQIGLPQHLRTRSRELREAAGS